MEIREEVQEFAKAMEKELQEKDEKYGTKGWKDMPNAFIQRKLTEEYAELIIGMINEDTENILEEAPQVAAHCMMIYDNNKE